jgi:hypothetical protein
MRKSRKLLMLSGVLGLVLAAASARPALATCYICFGTDDCTGEEIYGNNVCCSPGHGPRCSYQYDESTGCLVSVRTSCA